jgi:hypothetical protein
MLFWDEKDLIMNFEPRRTTGNSDLYTETRRSLNARLRRSTREMSGV